MKKWIMALLVVTMMVSYVFGSVTLQLYQKNYVDNLDGTGTVTVGVRSQSTYAWEITEFLGGFSPGAGLKEQYISHNFLSRFAGFTTAGDAYSIVENRDGNGNYYWQYTEVNGPTAQLDDKATTPWQDMLVLEIDFTWDGTKQTTFSWSGDYVTAMYSIWLITLPGPITIPIEMDVLAGTQVSSDLQDMSLPVEMGPITGEFKQNQVVLNWNTLSEVGNLGFEIYRLREMWDKGIVGEYELLEILPGAGNSSVGQAYSYADGNVEPNQTYTYRISQINQMGDTENNYYIMIYTKVPEAYSLSQNYPNPFNPETRIEYTLPEQAYVQLKIYNILGKEVRTLVNENQDANVHTAIWNGRDQNGVILPSGLYFYRLDAGNHVQVNKMMKLQ